jgi:hypothetical protein
MASADDFTAIARALAGATEAPHFDRLAFKVKRIFATLAADRQSANLKLAPDEQEFRVMMNPAAFAAVPNAWGRQGWTTITLANVSVDELRVALTAAWHHAVPAKPRH